MNRLKNIGFFIVIFILYLVINVYSGVFFIKDINSNNLVLINLALITSNLITVVIFAFIFHKTLVKDFYKFNKDDFKTGLYYWIIGVVLMIILNMIISLLGGTIVDNESSNRELIKNYLPYAIFGMCIYAPIVEELVFRRSLRNIFKYKYTYAFFSGLIFASIHLLDEITMFISTGTYTISLLYILPYMALGFCFALSYYKTNNIYSTITFHAMHNFIAILINIILLGVL